MIQMSTFLPPTFVELVRQDVHEPMFPCRLLVHGNHEQANERHQVYVVRPFENTLSDLKWVLRIGIEFASGRTSALAPNPTPAASLFLGFQHVLAVVGNNLVPDRHVAWSCQVKMQFRQRFVQFLQCHDINYTGKSPLMYSYATGPQSCLSTQAQKLLSVLVWK